MPRIEFKRKPRKDPDSAMWVTKDGSRVFIGRDYALQNQIQESLEKRNARGCFRECMSCGSCANSKRDNLHMQYMTREDGVTIAKAPTKSYDPANKEWVDCRSCEPYRFHDCHNGWMRNSRQEAEPFTEDAQKLLKKSGGKPLM